MTHAAIDCDLFHDRDDDVTEARHPTAGQRDAMDLLDIDPGHHPLVRLTLADWRRVDRVTAAIHR
ncbi:hypothetical protein [Blastococcus sp. CT_GayMR16]|uniref:hypothetical protein n=1 Tax=Blastococcus sp. CT_GayMR16 TaxID=2559607 RepID=UPI001073CAA8|nr:hypothetical protein [Blastococcus sp. CT_GayMR16]TFV90410.1 hypothetical protein E4P38_02930 [Blastococcus sp. CT_GayMR16]